MSKDGPAFSAARDLGVGWKVSPYIHIEGKTTATLAEVNEPGAIQQIWMTTRPECWRNAVLRMYWDDEINPSVEVPLGDFFCMGWKGEYHPVVSLPVAVNPMGGLNSYWEMPFHKNARITLENLDEIPMILFYQINACLTSVPEDAAQFHAQWRRSNPLPYKVPHTILDGVKGWGQYVGTYLAWGSNNNQWWGEGEIKFYLDGDQEYPTICGTGTEDYFCGAWGFETPKGQYGEFSSPYSGFWCVKTDGLNRSQTRFGMYRWHIMDPVRFEEDIKVTIQALGWRSGGRYLPLQDDIASTAFWYQNEPHVPFSPIPGKDDLEVI